MSRFSNCLVALLVAALTGCVTSPTVSPSASTAEPTAAQSPAVPSMPATSPEATLADPRLGETWELLDLGAGAEAYRVAYGEPGFVIVGRGCPVVDNCGAGQPTAWRSVDGTTWAAAALPRARGAVPTVVAYNRSYVAAGARSQNGEAEFLFWQSMDGVAWTLLGSFDRSCANGCPLLAHLAVAVDGSIVVTLEDRSHSGLGGPYRSADGTDWARVEATAFGYPNAVPVRVADVVALGSELVIVLAFGDDSAVAWASANGSEWRRIGPIDARSIYDLSLTAGGERLAAAIMTCVGACPTTVWIQGDAGSFWSAFLAPQLRSPKVAAAGAGWVLLGADLTVEPSPLRAWTSPDGETWTEHPTGLDWSECELRSIATGGSSVVAVGDPECSRPTVTSGAA